MSYNVTTVFPTEDTVNKDKQTIATRKETLFGVEFDTVVDLYESYQRSGYNIAVNYQTAVDEYDPFEVAAQLDDNGIEYQAKLKFLENSNKGSYEKVLELSDKIEHHGYYKYRVDVQLKIADDSVVDLHKESTWFNESDTLYKVTPDVKSKNIQELKGLYDDLMESGYLVDIEVKPKAKAEDDFMTRLKAFPEGTEIKFTLSDAVD